MKTKTTFSRKEILDSITETLYKAEHPRKPGRLERDGIQLDDMKARLGKYAGALIEVPTDHVTEGLITYEGLIFALLGAARILQMTKICGKTNV